MTLPHHVVLLGAMGSGKTTLGRLLAGRLGRQFFDSDQQILEETGRTGREIAGSDGVTLLHRMERDTLLGAIGRKEPLVIAAAASVVEDETVMTALSDCFCVWLEADSDTLARRVDQSSHRRRIEDPEGLLARRRQRYELAADSIIDTGVVTPEEALDMVVIAMGTLEA